MKKLIFLVLLVSFWSSCGNPFHGSRIVGNIFYGNIDPDLLVTPSRVSGSDGTYTYLQPGDNGYIDHYELYAGIDGVGTIRLMNFLIRPVIEVHHPCEQFIKDESIITDAPGPHYINMCRPPYPDLEKNSYAVVSVAPTDIGSRNPGYDYLSWGEPLRTADSTVVYPDCETGEKIEYIQEAVESLCGKLHENYYLGNPDQLTRPLSGKLYGMVDGLDPRTNLAIGGLKFNIEYDLSKITSIFVVAEPDPTRLSEENFDKNLPLGEDGSIILLGEKNGHFGSLDFNSFEGVIHGLMENPEGEQLYFEFTIYNNLDEDHVWF